MTETGATILVVDDEEPIRNVIARKLELVGHNCTVAADAREAIEKTFMQEFDLMLVDVKMPGMSGMEVLSHAAANHPDTGVIMITAVGDNRIAVEAKKKGAYDYVTKPFDLDDLELRVSRALERRGLAIRSAGPWLLRRSTALVLDHGKSWCGWRGVACGRIPSVAFGGAEVVAGVLQEAKHILAPVSPVSSGTNAVEFERSLVAPAPDAADADL
jgi:CheY-like chemotaxis protein